MAEPRFACAIASALRGEPLVATASQVRAWLLIEVRGAWGRDALDASDLGAHVTPRWRRSMSDRGIRVIAIRRDLDRDDHGVTIVHAIGARPGVRDGRAWSRRVASLADVVDATAGLADGPAGGGDPGDGWSPDPGPFLLVCTNGRHDPCCATYGRPLIRALRSSPRDARAWESSHIGGDRFAGNLVVLPDGLYFGRCSVDDVLRVVAAHDAGRLDLANYRGRSTYRLAEQAVEHHVRKALGLDSLDAIASIGHDDDGPYRVVVRDGDGERILRFDVARDAVPSPTPLTCKGDEGLQYPSFTVTELGSS